MHEGTADPFRDLTPGQREALTNNILATELLLDELVNLTSLHLRETRALCPRACLGEAVEIILDADPTIRTHLAIQAVRRLAEAQWEKTQ